jgi:hypothetical protein
MMMMADKEQRHRDVCNKIWIQKFQDYHLEAVVYCLIKII